MQPSRVEVHLCMPRSRGSSLICLLFLCCFACFCSMSAITNPKRVCAYFFDKRLHCLFVKIYTNVYIIVPIVVPNFWLSIHWLSVTLVTLWWLGLVVGPHVCVLVEPPSTRSATGFVYSHTYIYMLCTYVCLSRALYVVENCINARLRIPPFAMMRFWLSIRVFLHSHIHNTRTQQPVSVHCTVHWEK